jgi:hypothetical protein
MHLWHVNWDILIYFLFFISGYPDLLATKMWFWREMEAIGFIFSFLLSVIVNSIPNDFFDSGRDLRQGEPLFPLWFILVMETFRILMSRAMEGDFIDGLSECSRNTETLVISHLLFADDTMIFLMQTAI